MHILYGYVIIFLIPSFLNVCGAVYAEWKLLCGYLFLVPLKLSHYIKNACDYSSNCIKLRELFLKNACISTFILYGTFYDFVFKIPLNWRHYFEKCLRRFLIWYRTFYVNFCLKLRHYLKNMLAVRFDFIRNFFVTFFFEFNEN